jgi:hypothetical protein
VETPTSSEKNLADPKGLTSEEARGRLEKDGPNAMPDTSAHPLRNALAKFWAPVPWLLEASVVLEVVLHKYYEAAVIAALLVFNAALAYFQESRAQATLAALKSRLALNASKMPNSWQIGRITSRGEMLGLCFLAFSTAVLAVGKFRLHLGIEELQTLTVVSIVFGSQATTYVIRGRQHLWGLRPSIWLVLSSVTDVLIIFNFRKLWNRNEAIAHCCHSRRVCCCGCLRCGPECCQIFQLSHISIFPKHPEA